MMFTYNVWDDDNWTEGNEVYTFHKISEAIHFLCEKVAEKKPSAINYLEEDMRICWAEEARKEYFPSIYTDGWAVEKVKG